MTWNQLLKIAKEYGLSVVKQYDSYAKWFTTNVEFNHITTVFRRVSRLENGEIDIIYWSEDFVIGDTIKLEKYTTKQIKEMIETTIANAKKQNEEKMLEDAKKDF